MEAGAALDEAMDALAQKNEDLTEDVQTFAKALDGWASLWPMRKQKDVDWKQSEQSINRRETIYCGRWPPTNRCHRM